MITKIETAKFKCKTCEHIFEGIYTEGGIKAGTNFPLCPKCGSNDIRRANLLDKSYKFFIMPQLINIGNELVRINIAKNAIEYSQNGGRSWIIRYNNTSCGSFRDLLQYGREILACTSKGVCYSQNEGRSWILRCCNTSSYGEFISLQENGAELLANTSKGLYFSKNEGRSWIKRA